MWKCGDVEIRDAAKIRFYAMIWISKRKRIQLHVSAECCKLKADS